MLNKFLAVSLLPLIAVNVITNVPGVDAWGAAGHEIVATIAQIHLHPSTISTLCSILPEYSNCHLAPVATWADNVRMKMRWSSTLHYVNGVNDHPSQHCVFGEEGWQGTKDHNVLSAVRNTTMWLEEGYDGAEEALKFLVHFVGDLHQPLHLTGRDKGGNGAKVKFDGRVTNLHSVWDSGLIAKSLRTIPRNYTYPLPSKRIENALRGTIYDPYVRQIMYEGVLGRFKDDLFDWISCPIPDDFSSSESSPSSLSKSNKNVKSPRRPYPILLRRDQIPFNIAAADTDSDIQEGLKSTAPAVPGETDDEIVCPYAWAQPMHKLNCDIIWPPTLDDPAYDLRVPANYIELDTPEYSGRIKKEWLIERQLAMGGIRLAAVLNYLFADEEERSVLNLSFYD